jgi:hypothetical protein
MGVFKYFDPVCMGFASPQLKVIRCFSYRHTYIVSFFVHDNYDVWLFFTNYLFYPPMSFVFAKSIKWNQCRQLFNILEKKKLKSCQRFLRLLELTDNVHIDY